MFKAIFGYWDHQDSHQAIILSRVDYCNSLLEGSANYQLAKLQKIQNMGCRIIYNLRKYDHITEHMQDLHWLPIPERITYKIALLMFKVLNDLAPSYLSRPINKSHAIGGSHQMPIIKTGISNQSLQNIASSQTVFYSNRTKNLDQPNRGFKSWERHHRIQEETEDLSLWKLLWKWLSTLQILEYHNSFFFVMHLRNGLTSV